MENKSLTKTLSEIGEAKFNEEFNSLVKKGVYKENEYDKFITCVFCNKIAEGTCILSPKNYESCKIIQNGKEKRS
jgi:hypothetical protein